MLQIAFFLLSISICVFAWIMIHDPRTLWSGISLLGMLLCSAVTMFFLLSEYANWLAEHELLILSISVDTFNSKICGTYAAASRAA